MRSFVLCFAWGAIGGVAIGFHVYGSLKDVHLALGAFVFCVLIGAIGGQICSLLDKKR